MAVEIDNLTIGLLAVLAVLALYHRFSSSMPLVHPLLLGRQSEVSPVRQQGESGVYRSWATGQGTPLQVRPAGQLKTVGDAVKVPPSTPLPGKPIPPVGQRFILDTPLTNEALTEIIRIVPLGISTLFPKLDGSIVALLPPSPVTAFPLLLLSLASRPKTPLVILPHPRLLPAALSSSTHPTPQLLVIHEGLAGALPFESLHGASVLLVGDPNRKQEEFAQRAAKAGIVVKWWEEIWDAGEMADDIEDTTLYSDIHSYFYDEDGTVAKVTHMNLTAGVAGVMSLFPADKRPTSLDVVGSSIRLDTPFGMTVALASIYSGAAFRLIGPAVAAWDAPNVPDGELGMLATNLELPLPTILFLSSAHHAAIIKRLHDGFLASPFASVAARHRLRSLQDGHVSRGGLMDKLVWGSIRNTTLGGIAGDALRAVIVDGAPSQTDVALSHALIGLPLTRLHSSFLSTGPVFVTHFYDLQGPPVDMFKRKIDSENAHSGPPAANVEVVLKGPKTDYPETSENESKPFEGRIWIRGPTVIEQVGVIPSNGWIETPDEAAVYPNGCFVVRS